MVVDGLVNRITNHGVIRAADPFRDTAIAIYGAGGVTSLINHGTLSGRINNFGSALSVTNGEGARMYLPRSIPLGIGGSFTNAGYLIFNTQGDHAVSSATQEGPFTQLSTGTLGLKVNIPEGTVDQLTILPGHIYKLAGNIQPIILNPGKIAPGSVDRTIIANNGGSLTTDNLGIDLQSVLLRFSLNQNKSGLNLNATANFAPAGLSLFGSQVGRAIGHYQSAGSDAFFQAVTAQLVYQTDVTTLDQIYTGLAGTAMQSVSQTVYQAVNQGLGTYSDRLNDWRLSSTKSKVSSAKSFNPATYGNASATNPSIGPVTAENDSTPSDRNGPWISFFRANSYSDSLNNRIFGGTVAYEFESDQHEKMGGIGLTVSQSGYTYSNDLTPSIPGTSSNVGLSFYGITRGDRAYLSGIAYLGGGNTSFTRQLQALNFYDSTNVSVTSYVAAARLEAGYAFKPFQNENSSIQLTPFAAVQPTYIHQRNASENLPILGSEFKYPATDNTAVPVFLGLELSGQHTTQAGTKISSFVRASWMTETQQKGRMGASFSGQGVDLHFNGSPTMGNAMLYKAGSIITSDNVSGYLTLDYQHGDSSYAYRNLGVSVGMKFAF